MFKSKKKYGQNFLINDLIIDKIYDSVSVDKDDKILEIGPGKGYLTRKLKNFNTDLIAFEIDTDTKSFLDKLVDDKTKVVYNDFLSVNLKDYYSANDKIHVIANLPYYITTPIIEYLIKSKLNILDMTLMVQKEVAERLSAGAGSKKYGYITVYLNYYFEINKLFDVDKTNFDPMPKVDSSIIQLTKRNNKFNVDDEELFFQLIKDSFKLKRKNIKNNLIDYDLDKIANVLSRYNLDINSRAEDISIEIFVDIANELKK